MIGYYVHHHGHGHRHRATAVARHLGVPVTGLSSAPAPEDWPGAWVELPRDDVGTDVSDAAAGGVLHWAPTRDAGLLARMAAISAWLEATRPSLLVADVSVEVALLARLHGVPVVSMVLPGERDDDPHRTVHALSRRVVAAWPRQASGMVRGLEDVGERLVHVGGFSRFDGRTDVDARPRERPHVVVLMGSGGGGLPGTVLDQARAATPRWRWTVLDGTRSHWADDPWPLLRDADVVVTHAGQNIVAEVAAAQVPAVLLPQPRPHREQQTTARALVAGGWPVVPVDLDRSPRWGEVLEFARVLPTEQWRSWNDGGGALRMAALLEAEAAAA